MFKKGDKYWLGKKRPNMIGDKNTAWKGDDAGYTSVHMWVRKHWGKDKVCEICGTTRHSKYVWANKNHKYSRNRDDWMRLCSKCHFNYDITNGLRKNPRHYAYI